MWLSDAGSAKWFALARFSARAYHAVVQGPEREQMGMNRENERRGRLRSVGETLPKIAGRALGKQGLGEAQLVAQWGSVMGAELAGETLPVKLSFPQGGRRNGTLRLRVTPAAALTVQHREPQIIERVNGFFGYAAVARLALQQGPLPQRPAAEPGPRALSPSESAALAERLAQVPDSSVKSALLRLGAAILGTSRG